LAASKIRWKSCWKLSKVFQRSKIIFNAVPGDAAPATFVPYSISKRAEDNVNSRD
jgi:hypothetical protein